MSRKVTKTVLKEIRENIEKGEHEKAIQQCQDILKNDPMHYSTLLLMGAAYQTINKPEAVRYLRLALQTSPPLPAIPLSGLTTCAPIIELPQIYTQLLVLVPEKHQQYYEKLLSLSAYDQVWMECFDIFKNEAQNQHGERQQLSLKFLAVIYLTRDKLNNNGLDEKLSRQCLEVLLSDKKHELWLLASKRFLQLTFNQNDLVACVRQACETIENHPKEDIAYEWICKIYNKEYHENRTLWEAELKQPLVKYVDDLLQLKEHSSCALLTKAIILYQQSQYIQARELLYKVQKLQPSNTVALELLARTEMSIGAYRMAMPILQKLGNDFQCEFAICLAQENDKKSLHQAVEILQNCPPTADNVKALARCYFVLKQDKQLDQLDLDFLTRTEFKMMPKEAIEMLTSKQSSYVDNFDYSFLMAKLYIKLESWSEGLAWMLKSTKLRPYYAECFMSLAKIYSALGDEGRAKKCYEKGLNLYPVNEQAVTMLSALYQKADQFEENYTLLCKTLNSMTTDDHSEVIHYRLGLHYLRVKKYDDAIQSFRNAIKSDVSCISYWESLGDAYSERGSYNSAIRVFEKVLEMEPSNVYAKLQKALIKKTIRHFTESIVEFDNLLLENAEYLPSLKGAAEAHIGIAGDLKAEKRYGRCKDHLQYAVKYLERAFLIVKNHDMVWLWRLAANVFLMTAQLPLTLANLDVTGMLVKQDEEMVYLTRQDLFKFAARFYTCALSIKQNTFLWYDLAVCLYLNATYMPEDAKDTLDLSIKACKMAINSNNLRWQNWNLLGVIYMHDSKFNLRMAQHCFIQALNIERKSYITWTNLGVLYLTLNEVKLANQAFQRAQQSSPIYAQAWIGQAMIAEKIGEEEEALDLYRHCQQFEYHPESALGYAHWICTELSNTRKCELARMKHAIYKMHGNIIALDAILWYIQNEEKEASVSAFTFAGFLCEREQLYRGEEKVYLKGTKAAYCEQDRNKILTNLGYLYMKLNKPQESIKAFNMVSQATFKPLIGLALAYAMVDQHQESYSMYSSVLDDETHAAQVLVAMAAMVYKYQGEADTKTILYQCILLKDPPIEALYSACALGIIHNDSQLVDTMLSELKKHANVLKHAADVAFLNAQHLVSQKKTQKALLHLISRVHVFPHCVELRKVLASFLSTYYENDYNMATNQIALSVIELTHRYSLQKVKSEDDARHLLIAARALQEHDPKRALKLIQQALHLQPQDHKIRKELHKFYNF